MRKQSITGKELKAARRRTGINQADFGRSVGVSRHTISYWETKNLIVFSPFGLRGTLASIIGALDLPVYSRSNARARGWGLSDSQQAMLDRKIAKRLAELEARRAIQASRQRLICGAKTRKGHRCRLKSEPGRRRCKFHGGMSTGPKTAEGRAKISEAQRERWRKWKANRKR